MRQITTTADILRGADWFTSSYSNAQGGDCVEGARIWFKSSYSNDQGGDCVEGARLGGDAMAIRDSKAPTGPAFLFPADAWSTFLTTVKRGDLSA
jgi:hypothetical protein